LVQVSPNVLYGIRHQSGFRKESGWLGRDSPFDLSRKKSRV